MTNKQKEADEIFGQGFNCAQATLTPFAEELGLDRGSALKLTSGFGAGMKRGETCGAVTGSVMALGLKRGHTVPNDEDSKKGGYVLPALFLKQFEEKFGSIRCKELLGLDPADEKELAQIKEQGLFKSKCPVFVKKAAAIVEEILSQN
ncbi:MAG: C-GCAxxG-C-C family protein [Spirochaetales bacterium]|nr:C-GCAxxG-C-C family protein [Spirochaetales bacterium]